MSRRDRGFTLIEMLIVIAVIGILMAITFPVVSGVKTRQKAKATKVLIETLKLKLEAYCADFGDYPPSNPRLVGLPSNGINDGIECLVRCLSTKKKNGPYFEFPEDQLKNVDHDQVVVGNPTDSYMNSRELFELIDGFGNSLVYIHNADYDTGHKAQTTEDAEIVPVKGCKSPKTGQYYGVKSYQIFSFGANGKNDGGLEDDIGSWSSGE
ncbi:MAG TPA: prepilin-type N-terminal cleavage/methylation domain-containing protein [Planctomycetota bacterium]|nr:prepilin-type N-terminal cleavage/methylation domain-containing protein [Planctomycetota bacterium]